MTEERFLNTYHNASTPPSPDVPPPLATFMRAADLVFRAGGRACQGAYPRSSGGGNAAHR